MNNQAASDRIELAKLLNISEEQLGYVTNADAGCGLMRIGNALIPFINRISPNSSRYRLMSTKPSEFLPTAKTELPSAFTRTDEITRQLCSSGS